MSGCLNKVCLIGNVGNKPEIRTLKDGREMATFSLATSETWKTKSTNEKVVKTEWHRITVFSPGLVSVIKEFVGSGARLYIEGSLKSNKWAGSDGIERTSTDIVLQSYNSTLVMLDKKDQGSTKFIPDKPEPNFEMQEDVSRFERQESLIANDVVLPF